MDAILTNHSVNVLQLKKHHQLHSDESIIIGSHISNIDVDLWRNAA